jgi:hypothetical protein
LVERHWNAPHARLCVVLREPSGSFAVKSMSYREQELQVDADCRKVF